MSAIAPTAPGRLGDQLDPQLLLTYLDQLQGWLAARRAELDELDAAVQASGHVAELTADIRLGLTLWQAIRTRTDQMLKTWDSGRVGPVEREQLSQLIWGRLETPGAPGGMGMSVPEAGKLSDALTAQLRQRLQIDPAGSAVTSRVRDLRAQLERLRDQIALEPADNADAARTKLASLASRVQNVVEKAGRGGDVGGLLGPLEADAATFERDLIVGGALRRQNAGRVSQVTAQLDALKAREPGLRALVAEVASAVTPAPKYAVPDVSRLGGVPATAAELDAYATQLTQVGRALDLVEKANSDALAEVTRLRSDLDSVRAKASDAAGAAMVSAADAVLAQTPVPLDAARSLVAGVRAYADRLGER